MDNTSSISSFSNQLVFQLLDCLGLYSHAVYIRFHIAGKGLGMNQDAEFIAMADAEAGEVGAAEKGFVLIHQNDFLVHGAVFLDEANFDSVVLQGVGVIEGGVTNGHGRAFAEFGKHHCFQSGPSLLANGVINGLDGFVAAAADVIGQNPDAGASGVDGLLNGFAEGFGGETPREMLFTVLVSYL